MGRITDRKFFTCTAEELAPKLLGKIICHETEDKDGKFTIKARIKVAEAYPVGDESLDNAPAQNLEGGRLYFHHNTADGRKRMDIVAGEESSAQSVLIAETDLYDGPQKTLWALDIDNPEYDGLDLISEDSPVWLEDDGTTVTGYVTDRRRRINDDKPLRFIATGFSFEK